MVLAEAAFAEIETPSKKVELSKDLQYKIKQYAHRKWLSDQPFSRTLWSSRTDLTSELDGIAMENKPKRLQGHPWMAPYEALEKFATPKIVDSKQVFDDREDLNARAYAFIEDVVDYAKANPEEVGFDPSLSPEEIATEMRAEMLDTLGAAGTDGIAKWRENIWVKGLPANNNWIFVAQAILTQAGIQDPENLTEDDVLRLHSIRGKLEQVGSLKSPSEIAAFLKLNPDLMQIMVLAHDGWREDFHSLPDVFADFSESANSDVEKYTEMVRNKLQELAVTPLEGAKMNDYYQQIRSTVTKIRREAQQETEIASQSTFTLMFDIVETLEFYRDNQNLDPVLREGIQTMLNDMLYEIKADANPQVIEAIIENSGYEPTVSS